MIELLKRYLARRRLGVVVSALPRRLEQDFGAAEHYTYLQVARAIGDLRLDEAVRPYAFAVACAPDEMARAGLGADDCRRLRGELAELFQLPGPGFTIGDLTRRSYSSHSPAPENVYAGSGPDHH